MAIRVRSEDAKGWEIYRFEFVFLNPEEHRWQMFQMWPDARPSRRRTVLTKQPVYRRHAKDLLQWVHRTARSLGYRMAEAPGDGSGPAGEVIIDTGKIRDQLLSCFQSKPEEDRETALADFIERYCRHLERTMKIEGVARTPLKWLHGIKNAEPSTVKLRRSDAFDLASTLFLANHWDVFGRLSYPLDRLPVISAARLSSFGYVITYGDSPADNPVGYEVKLKFQAAKGQSESESNEIFGELLNTRDYFEQCNPISEHEGPWYALYGIIIDQINKSEADKAPVYVRCFPLRICGYDHFLQVLIRKVPDGLVDSLPAIFPPSLPPAAGAKKGASCLPVIKECLRELIVQMHVAAFQKHARDRLSANTSETADLYQLFAQHAPNLVRMSRLWVGEDLFYGYFPHEEHRFQVWRQWNDRDSKRPPQRPRNSWNEHFVEIANGRILVEVPWEPDFVALDPLLGGTGRQRLEEQWDWLSVFAQEARIIQQLRQISAELDFYRAGRSTRPRQAKRTAR